MYTCLSLVFIQRNGVFVVLGRLRSAMSEKAEQGLLPSQLEACRFNKCLLLLQCGKVRKGISMARWDVYIRDQGNILTVEVVTRLRTHASSYAFPFNLSFESCTLI